MPKVSIIITTWNSESHINGLFMSLLKMDYNKADWDLVIIDNHSTDSSKDLLLAWQKKLHNLKTIIYNTENRGFSPAYNQGIEIALKDKPDYIALLNDDTIVTPNWLSIIIEKMKADPQIGLAQPLLTRYPKSDKINSFGNCLHYLGFGFSYGENQPIKFFEQQKILNDYEPAYLSFTAVVIKRQVIKQIGLLDPNYFAYHEDTDYCLRARLAGWKLLAAKHSIVHHKYQFPSKKNKKRYFYLERNRYYLVLKFFKLKTLLLITPACLIMEIGLIIFSIIRGFFWQRIHAYFWILKNFAKISRERKKIQSTRKTGDRKLYKFMSGKIEFQEINNPLLDIANPLLNLYFKLIKRII